jgi:hypothetical protein
MSGQWIARLGLVTVLALPVAVFAHGGHVHKVMGTVARVNGTLLEVKGTDGKLVTVTLDSKTAITRGKAKLDVAAVKIGERVSIDYMQEKNANMAKAVKLGTAPAAK